MTFDDPNDRRNLLTPKGEPWYKEDDGTVNDREHLLDVLSTAESDLQTFFHKVEPSLARNLSGPMMRAARLHYYRVFDALTHSVEWVRRMPAYASDGTRVWEESAPAVTNEVRTDDPDEVEASKAGGASVREDRRSGDGDHQDDGGREKLERQLRIAQWQARNKGEKTAAAKAQRRRWPARKGKGRR